MILKSLDLEAYPPISRLVQVHARDWQPSRDLGGAAYQGISTECWSLGRRDEVSGRDTSTNAKLLKGFWIKAGVVEHTPKRSCGRIGDRQTPSVPIPQCLHSERPTAASQSGRYVALAMSHCTMGFAGLTRRTIDEPCLRAGRDY